MFGIRVETRECAVSSSEDREFKRRMERVESLVHDLEQSPDAATVARAQEIIQSVIELHGAALERMLEMLEGAGAAGRALIDSLAEDGVVSSVLLLHGIHPLDLETRVRRALDGVRPLLRTHGGNVELVDLAGGVVRLRLVGSCDGCPSSALTVKSAIEEAIIERAPDITGIVVDDSAGNGHAAAGGLVQIALPILQR
jgi:Fe-S cluster biogenesis protein NfuA